MKNLFLLFLLLLPYVLEARVVSAKLDTSGTNLTSTYTAVAIPVITAVKSIAIENRSATEIAVSCSTGLGVAPSSGTSAVIYVNAGEVWVLDNAGLTSYCYWKSTGSTISSGILILTAIGN